MRFTPSARRQRDDQLQLGATWHRPARTSKGAICILRAARRGAGLLSIGDEHFGQHLGYCHLAQPLSGAEQVVGGDGCSSPIRRRPSPGAGAPRRSGCPGSPTHLRPRGAGWPELPGGEPSREHDCEPLCNSLRRPNTKEQPTAPPRFGNSAVHRARPPPTVADAYALFPVKTGHIGRFVGHD